MTRPWYTTRGSRPRIASKRSDAAAVVPPGTRPRSRSDATSPASTRRATRPTRASRPGGETLQVEAPGRDDDRCIAQRRPLEQVAAADVGLRGHREEELAVGEAQ